jgi:hypothetical protein
MSDAHQSLKINTGGGGFRAPSNFQFYTDMGWVESKMVIGISNNASVDPNMTTVIANNPSYSLFVGGGIMTEDVLVKLKGNWADYVFASDYKLLSLNATEKYITENKHLPNIPSAKKVVENGISLGEMSILQMEKIEELTLHLIQMNKEKEGLQAKQVLLERRLSKLESLMAK